MKHEHKTIYFQFQLVCLFYAFACANQAFAEESPVPNSPVEIFAGDKQGELAAWWRMPSRDALFMCHLAKFVLDDELRAALAASMSSLGVLDLENRESLKREVVGMLTTEREKAPFFIDHCFIDRAGTHMLYIKLPAHQALGLLKVAFLVGDNRLKYQVMHFGFRQYTADNVREDCLAFLAHERVRLNNVVSKGETMFGMFAINSHSKHTRQVLEQCRSLPGDGEDEVFIRGAAQDLLRYVDTGDESILGKYTVTTRSGQAE